MADKLNYDRINSVTLDYLLHTPDCLDNAIDFADSVETLDFLRTECHKRGIDFKAAMLRVLSRPRPFEKLTKEGYVSGGSISSPFTYE